MDHHDVTVSIVSACVNAGAPAAAADALRVADRLAYMFANDNNRDTIRFDVLNAVRAAIMGEPDPIRPYGINLNFPGTASSMAAQIHNRVAHMLNQTRAWGPS